MVFFSIFFLKIYNSIFIRMTLGTKTKEKTLLIWSFFYLILCCSIQNDFFTCCSIQSFVSAYTVFHIKNFNSVLNSIDMICIEKE